MRPMITADEVRLTYTNDFTNYIDSFSGKDMIAAICADLGIDKSIPYVFAEMNIISLARVANWFHGFVFAVWLMREKKGL